MSRSIKILITGDTHLGGGRIKDLAQDYSSEPLFGDLLEIIKKPNLSVTNLESPLINTGRPILKTGPNLKSPTQTLGILKSAGFDLLTLANNHIMDFGEEGLRSTLKTCDKAGIEAVGAGLSKEASQRPFLRKINGFRIAIINIAENEFGTTRNNSAGAHSLNPVQNYYSIKEISQSVHYVIVIVHGGHENYSLPSPRMKETYRFFIDAGAHAVVGHHPHCYSGFEVYKGAPIFYSLGNFLFDNGAQSISSWNEGFMVSFNIDENKLSFEIIPYIQNAETVGLRKLLDEENFLFQEKISQLNEIIVDDQQLEKNFAEFCESSRNLYSSYIEPHSVKYLHALRNRNLFPSLLGERKKRLLLNLTRCEAHRDVLQKILEQ